MDTKQLRQKILDLAIRGKLVPQDPNDEPASVLLERVKAEKERLIAEGKIKRSKKSATSSDKPHYAEWDLPSGWVWVKLSDLASFGGGKTPSMSDNSYWENGKHLWVTSKDMKSHRIRDSRMKISDEALTIMTQYKPGAILIVTRSGILRHSLPIAILENDATINQDLKAITFYIQDLHPYIYYAIKAQESFILKEYHKDGTTVDSINFEKFSDILLPIPPKQEQIRIVTTIEKLFGLIEEIDNNKKYLQEFLRHTKSIILDMAVCGKLVQHEPTDEPSEILLKRINPNAVVSTDKSHYGQLPNGWSYTTMNFICQLYDGEKIENKELINLDAKYLRGKSEGNILNKGRFTPEKTTMILVDGENSGEIFTAPIDGYQGSTFKLLDISEEMNAEYVKLIIRIYQKRLRDNKVGSAIPHLNKKMFREILVPVPPIAEQIRIVRRTYELMSKISELTEAL